MWTPENRKRYDRSQLRYPSDLTDEEWALVKPVIPPAKRGGRKREADERDVLNAICTCSRPVASGGRCRRISVQKHGVVLSGFMELRRHTGADPLRALCKMPGEGGTRGKSNSCHT